MIWFFVRAAMAHHNTLLTAMQEIIFSRLRFFVLVVWRTFVKTVFQNSRPKIVTRVVTISHISIIKLEIYYFLFIYKTLVWKWHFLCIYKTFFCKGKLSSYTLTLSWRRQLSYRNQSIDLLRKSMDWFLYDNDLRHERVKGIKFRRYLILWFGDCKTFHGCLISRF